MQIDSAQTTTVCAFWARKRSAIGRELILAVKSGRVDVNLACHLAECESCKASWDSQFAVMKERSGKLEPVKS